MLGVWRFEHFHRCSDTNDSCSFYLGMFVCNRIGSVVQSKDVSCVASRQTKPRVTRFGSDGSTSSKLLPRILLRVSIQAV